MKEKFETVGSFEVPEGVELMEFLLDSEGNPNDFDIVTPSGEVIRNLSLV